MTPENEIDKVKLTRVSYYDLADHMQDNIKNHGYDYNKTLFEKSISSYILADNLRGQIISRFTLMFAEIIDRVKDIKRSRYFAMDKKYKKFN